MIDKISEFAQLTLSDADTIKVLIKFRTKLDMYYGMVQNYDIFEAGIIKKWDEDLLCLYIDLVNLINKIRFTKKQREIIDYFMNEGLTVEDISKIYEEDSNNIEQILDTISAKIKKQNDEDWRQVVMLNYIRDKTEYKKCSRCGEWKPATEDYFYRDKTGKYNVRGMCKNCHNE